MTKKDIVRIVSEELNLPQQKAKEIVQKTFDTIINGLKKDRRIELRNFGVFTVKDRAARSARNPRTGEEVWVDARQAVTFKSGKIMSNNIQLEKKKAKKAKSSAKATKAVGKDAVKATKAVGKDAVKATKPASAKATKAVAKDAVKAAPVKAVKETAAKATSAKKAKK